MKAVALGYLNVYHEMRQIIRSTDGSFVLEQEVPPPLRLKQKDQKGSGVAPSHRGERLKVLFICGFSHMTNSIHKSITEIIFSMLKLILQIFILY